MKDVKKESVSRESTIKKNAAKHRKRRKRNLSLYYLLMGVLTVSVLLVLSLTVFFRITEVKIIGESAYYSNEEIILSAGVPIGGNLIVFNANNSENNILNKFLMIDSVEIKKKLPSVIEITVKDATPFFQIPSDDGRFLTVSSNFKVLAITAEPDSTLIQIEGLTPLTLREGGLILGEMNGREEIISTIYAEFSSYGITDIRLVNFLSATDIRVNIEDRLEVKLGSESKIEYKIKLVSAVINDKIEKDEIGVIDATVPGTAGFTPQ